MGLFITELAIKQEIVKPFVHIMAGGDVGSLGFIPTGPVYLLTSSGEGSQQDRFTRTEQGVFSAILTLGEPESTPR